MIIARSDQARIMRRVVNGSSARVSGEASKESEKKEEKTKKQCKQCKRRSAEPGLGVAANKLSEETRNG